jgi:hypothetical protein
LPLPDDGKKVPKNSFWLRRLKEGDVTEYKPEKPKKSKSKKKGDE